MLTFEEFLSENNGDLEEGALKHKVIHYAKAVARNVLAPHYAAGRRYGTQRHVDRYKMHKRIVNDPTSSKEDKEKSKKKMAMHKAAVGRLMGGDEK